MSFVSVGYDLLGSASCSGATAVMQFGLFVGKKEVLSGTWQALLWHNGDLLQNVSEWNESYSQKEDGYELTIIEIQLEMDFMLRRYFLLDEVDKIFITGDAILHASLNNPKNQDQKEHYNNTPNLAYESIYNLSERFIISHGYANSGQNKKRNNNSQKNDILFRPVPKNDQMFKPLFRVIPLVMSELTFLQAKQDRLHLRQDCVANAMFAPLFFDFKRTRLERDFSWCELTVGEELEKVQHDKAAGFRIQLGKEQFLLYASLTQPANRTLLGHNLIDEFCFAKFDPKKGVETLVSK
ncbi:MAG: hypothetical protein LBQ66_01950 [Planctomycetaceae bacterium]|jgi:hypothetical protein|nr:hypothetical protein [Planctomycetaceae bacterium]